MAVFCAKCGEELLGAINRCWRCGTEYESRSGRVDVPPIRRAPIRVPLFGALEAELLDATTAAGNGANEPRSLRPASQGQPGGQDPPGGQDSPDGQDPPAGAAVIQVPQMRRGSPFRTEESTLVEDAAGSEFPASHKPLATVYPKYAGASAGSIVAITLGLCGLGLSKPIPLAGILIAGVGLGMGVWGLYSKKRRAAIFGLLLCCLAVTVSGFFLAVELYRLVNGVPPWETSP